MQVLLLHPVCSEGGEDGWEEADARGELPFWGCSSFQDDFSPVSQFAVSLQSSHCLIRSFLFYGDDPKTWQQLWCVIARTEPATLQLFAAQQVGQETGTTSPAIKALTFFPRRQEAAPLSCIPLSGCEVDESCPEVQGLPCFRLKQPSGAHTFCCEGAELQRSWLAVLKDALTGKTRANTLGSCDKPTSGPSCETTSGASEECVHTAVKEELI